MFKLGDRVVYPMHGAGIIEAIEEKEILGEKQQYYIMRLPLGDMRVMIPLRNANVIGIREVVSDDGLEQALAVLQEAETSMPSNWNQRYRANLEKIRTGDIMTVAEVMRNLVKRDQEKGLSTGERKMLDTARQIFVSELILVRDMEEESAMRLIDGLLGS
ncbi:MAG TPA: CarD family transcriptional regulator [Firmicutes bacterium]|nr:CarD family transcriptional regulator [Bacillota bacterium]